jgi:hypothetical protein
MITNCVPYLQRDKDEHIVDSQISHGQFVIVVASE